jgi:HEAT repeat protein
MGLIARVFGPNIDRLLADKDLDGLVQVLSHKRSELRCQAVQALAELGGEQAVTGIIGALGDQDEQVNATATTCLRQLGQQAGPQLTAALGHEAETVSQAAFALLGELEPPPLASMVAILKDGNDQARDLATGLLVSQAPQTSDSDTREQLLRALLPVLGDRQPELRKRAADGLAEIGDERAARALAAQLKDGDETVRHACAEAMRRIGSPAIPYLLDALADRNANARALAAGLLAGLLPDEPEPGLRSSVVERLRQAVNDREPKVAASATDALDQLGIAAVDGASSESEP